MLATMIFTATGCKPPAARALLSGKKHLEKGDYTKAVSELGTAVTLMPTNAQAWNFLGLAYHHAGNAADAAKAYNRALLLDHDLSEAHYNLGCLLLEHRKPESARNELMAYILRRGNTPDALVKLGAAQIRSRDYSGADKSFTEATKLAPTNCEAMNGLGVAKYFQRRPGDAGQLFYSALKADASCAPAWFNLAVLAQLTQDWSSAIKNYREYLRLAPSAENAVQVAAALKQLEQGSEGVPAQQPSTPSPAAPQRQRQSLSAASQQKSGAAAGNPADPKLARNVNAPAPASASGDSPTSLRTTAEMFFEQGTRAQSEQQLAVAIAAYRKATATDPSYYEAWFNLGAAANQSGILSEAIDAYQKAVSLNPDSLDSGYNLALAQRQAGKYQEAARELEALLKAYPDESRAHLALANLYAQQLRQPSKARPHYVKVLQSDPKNPQSDAIRLWMAAH
jgi:Flp pilus assembly protein TadD